VSDRRLRLFAKEPHPGRVKTRLAPWLGAVQAASLYEAFVRDVVWRHPAATIYHAPDPAGPILADLGCELRGQRSGDLGDRLAAAFAAELDGPVVIIGCDSPDLPADRIEAAFGLLAERDVVIGPAVDGGYYLIGARVAPNPLLESIPWGTAGVLDKTIAAAHGAGLSLAVLEPWYDVDRPADVRFLRSHLELLWRARGEDRCPRTRAHLESIDLDGSET